LQAFQAHAEKNEGVLVELFSAPERTVSAKGLLTSVFTVTNTGTKEDVYELKILVPPGWNVISSLAPITLSSGQSKTLTVTVFTPQTALTGVPYEISLSAISQKNPKIFSASSMKVNVLPRARIKVFGPQDKGQELNGIQGQDISYKFTVTNLGNGKDLIQINAVSAHGEKVDLSKEKLELAVGGQSEVIATIHVPLDVSPGTKHVLFFKASSALLEKGVFDEVKVYTSILERRPRKEEGMYKSLPSQATFYISGLGTGKNIGPQVHFRTYGDVTDRQWVDFNYEGPYYKDRENYRGMTEEKISLNTGARHWDAGVGDINVSMSELTVSSLSERGARFHVGEKPVGITAFSLQRKEISFTEDFQGARITSDITKDTEIAANFFKSDEDKTDPSASRAAEKKEIMSLSAAQYIKAFSVHGEYAKSKFDKGEGSKDDSAWWVNPKIRSQRINADAEYLHAGANYPGRRSDNEAYRLYLSYRLLKPFWAWVHKQKLRDNLDRDLTKNINHKDLLEVGASITAKKFPFLSLSYETNDSKSEKAAILSDLKEKSVVFRSETAVGIYNTLSFDSKWSQKKDPVAPQSTKTLEYTSRLYSRFQKFNTWMGYTYILENDILQNEKSSSKRKEVGLTYQPSARFYSSLSFSQEGATDQRNSNIITMDFSYHPQDYESFHLEAEQRNDAAFNKEWQVWLAYRRDFDLPLFFIKVKGALKGVVFIDDNNNGILDKAESAASGITFKLGEDKAAANKNGVFIFPSVEPGEYGLDIDMSTLPVGLASRIPLPHTARVKRGHTEIVNIPLVRVSRVSGIVFEDINKDGIMDEGENGLALIRVALESETFKSRDTFTAQDGRFTFATVAPGEYVIRIDKEWLASRFIMTTPEEYQLEIAPSKDMPNIAFGAAEKERPIIKTYSTVPEEPIKPKELPKPKNPENPVLILIRRYIFKK